MHLAERIVTYTYYAFISTIFILLCVSTLVWTVRVYYLGHFPNKRPKWLKRPIKEMLNV